MNEIPVVLRPHQAYANPLDGGWAGFQAACWDCDWTGTEFLWGEEGFGTEEGRAHKRNAHREAREHEATASPVRSCSRCKRSLPSVEDE